MVALCSAAQYLHSCWLTLSHGLCVFICMLALKIELMADVCTCRCGRQDSSRHLAASTLASRPQASRDRSSSRSLVAELAQQWERYLHGYWVMTFAAGLVAWLSSRLAATTLQQPCTV